MTARHIVVDGSNLATEGRSIPSLAQLDEAVREYKKEHPDDVVTVVVDATFGHRIPEPERAMFDEAVAHNEVVSPPAGAIGRGDAFLLRVAEKVGATVLSNDSFQEFHGEHEWLFEEGRLIGGKPVPEVGWVFTPRTPVRGPRSREAIRTAKKATGAPRADEQQKVRQAIAAATEEAVEPDSPAAKRRPRRRTGAPPADPVNEPLAFIEFVANHPLGSEVEGEVDSFSSHGAFVAVDGARCYVPLSGLGRPPPRAAREVLRKGEHRAFVVQALDPARRGVELALPEFAHVSGEPTAETVEEEIRGGAGRGEPDPADAAQAPTTAPAPGVDPAEEPSPAEKTAKALTEKAAHKAAKKAAKRVTAAKRSTATATVKKATATAKKATAKKKTTAKNAAAAKKDTTTAKKAAPAKKATAKKATAKKATADLASGNEVVAP